MTEVVYHLLRDTRHQPGEGPLSEGRDVLRGGQAAGSQSQSINELNPVAQAPNHELINVIRHHLRDWTVSINPEGCMRSQEGRWV